MRKQRSPRIAITLSDEAHGVVSEVARLQKVTKVAVVSEFIDAALPALQAMRDALRVVVEQPKEAERMLARYANAATASLAQAQLEFSEHVDARTVRGKRRKRGQTT